MDKFCGIIYRPYGAQINFNHILFYQYVVPKGTVILAEIFKKNALSIQHPIFIRRMPNFLFEQPCKMLRIFKA